MDATGNEEADELAKQAALGSSTETRNLPRALRKPIAVSASATRQRLTKEMQIKWIQLWKRSARYVKTSRIEPKLPSKRYLKSTRTLRRNQSAILTQFRTGHVLLNTLPALPRYTGDRAALALPHGMQELRTTTIQPSSKTETKSL